MRESAAQVVTAFHAAVDSLLALDLAGLAGDELLEVVGDTEAAFRCSVAVQHLQTAEVDRRGLAHERGCASTSVLLSQLLRISTGEARARVKAADELAPRRSFTGEVLAPLHPVVAAAQIAGDISASHASVITSTIAKLPAAFDIDDKVAQVETFLTEQARLLAPEPLGKICRHLLDVIDPDGTLDPDRQQRRRSLTIRQRPDGTVSGEFEGTAELGELLKTVLDVTAAPKPATDGTRDQRSAEQRNHDGLVDALRLMLRTQDLPTANGVVATVILTMTTEQWTSEQGLATTGHGALVTVTEAKRIARGEAKLFPVVLNSDGDAEDGSPPPGCPPTISKIFRRARPIAAYGTTHRIFTSNERLAFAARDRGCTHPGCTVPVLWCEADHVTDWKDTGRTSVDDGHLACGFHHRLKDTEGWTTSVINGLPHWTAPVWLDPTRTPQRNRAHDPVVVG